MRDHYIGCKSHTHDLTPAKSRACRKGQSGVGVNTVRAIAFWTKQQGPVHHAVPGRDEPEKAKEVHGLCRVIQPELVFRDPEILRKSWNVRTLISVLNGGGFGPGSP